MFSKMSFTLISAPRSLCALIQSTSDGLNGLDDVQVKPSWEYFFAYDCEKWFMYFCPELVSQFKRSSLLEKYPQACGQSYKHFTIVNYDSRVLIWATFYLEDSRVINCDRKVLYKIGHCLAAQWSPASGTTKEPQVRRLKSRSSKPSKNLLNGSKCEVVISTGFFPEMLSQAF